MNRFIARFLSILIFSIVITFAPLKVFAFSPIVASELAGYISSWAAANATKLTLATTAVTSIGTITGVIVNKFETMLGNGPKSLMGSTLNANLGVSGDYQNKQSKLSNTYGKNINTSIFGQSNTFNNQLQSYKSGGKTCTTSSDGTKHCYSNLNSNTLYNTDNLNQPGRHKAAMDYAKNASGASTGMAKPNYSQTSPENVKYSAYYHTQASSQSVAINNMAQSLGGRTPYSGPESTSKYKNEHSPLSFHNKAFVNYNTSKEYRDKYSSKQTIGAQQTTAAHSQMTRNQIAARQSQHMSNISSGVSALHTTANQGMQYSIGNQLKANADQASSGTPFKKQPHE